MSLSRARGPPTPFYVESLNHYFKEENMMQHERIPRPDEVIGGYDTELEEEGKAPSPLPCFKSVGTDNPCPRPASVWMYGDRKWPACEEHRRAIEIQEVLMELDLAVEIAGDWLRIARSWGNDGLERETDRMLIGLRREAERGRHRAEIAVEIAEAPRRQRGPDAPELPPDQEERLKGLIRRADGLVAAYTAIEDAPSEAGTISEETRRRSLAVLADEMEKAHEAAHRYQEEIGLRRASSSPEEAEEPDVLTEINVGLSGARERLGDLDPEAFADPEAYWRAAQAISLAGSIVSGERTRRRRERERGGAGEPGAPEPENGGRASA